MTRTRPIILPENGASMCHDTRENEGPCICDDCKKDPFECGYDHLFCEQCAEEGKRQEYEDALRDSL